MSTHMEKVMAEMETSLDPVKYIAYLKEAIKMRDKEIKDLTRALKKARVRISFYHDLDPVLVDIDDALHLHHAPKTLCCNSGKTCCQ